MSYRETDVKTATECLYGIIIIVPSAIHHRHQRSCRHIAAGTRILIKTIAANSCNRFR